MAFRTFQLCIVFTISGILTNISVLSNLTTESPASTPSLNTPPLTVHIERPFQNVILVPRGQSVSIDCPAHSSSGGSTTGSGSLLSLSSTTYRLLAPSSASSPTKSNPQYVWLFNNRPIQYANQKQYKLFSNGTLFINEVTGKKGSYRCQLKNHVGTIVTEPITIKIPMLSRTFLEEPGNITAEEGDNVLLKCRIKSVPEAIIYWEHNSKPVNTSSRYTFLPNGSLLILRVQKMEDEGLYSCTATNQIQKKTRRSNSGRLYVIPNESQPKKPQIVTGNMTQVVVKHLGENANIYCFANGYPKPTIRWSVPLNSTVNKTLSYNSSFLPLVNITTEAANNYTCEAKNSLGVDSQTWLILLAPYIIEKPISRHVPSARTVRLNCSAGGWPPPKIQWLKNGEMLWRGREHYETPIENKFGRFTIKPDNMLVIADTVTSDSGLYQCVAMNAAGEVRIEARVLVSLKNKAPSPPSNITCRPYTSRSVCLTWNPPLNFKIQAYTVHYMPSDGGQEQQHPTNETNSLIESLEPNTYYRFYLRAYSETASDQSESIICSGANNHNREVILEPESPEVLNVRWTPLLNDTPCGETVQYKVQWRRFGHPSNSAKLVNDIFTNKKIYRYQISDLVPSETYEIRVLTLYSNESEPWTAITMPNTTFNNISKSASSILNLEAIPTSPNSINITWQPVQIDNFGYYNICYTEQNALENCDGTTGTYIKSLINSIEIKNLKSYTVYRFQVRVHDKDANSGNFSHIVECRTIEGQPGPVRSLTSTFLNSTTKLIEWQAPSQPNGIIRNYTVYYASRYCETPVSLTDLPTTTSNCKDWRYHKWHSIVVPSNVFKVKLTNLKPRVEYNVTVVAETNAGKGKPVSILTQFFSLFPADETGHLEKVNNTEQIHNQTVGIIIGCSIAALCIALCTAYLMLYRRCLKSNLNAHQHRMYSASSQRNRTNGHRSSTTATDRYSLTTTAASNLQGSSLHYHTSTGGGTDSECSVSLPLTTTAVASTNCGDETCSSQQEIGEAHEMQCLVLNNSCIRDNISSHIPPVIDDHLDTKGASTFPNGRINGFKYPLNNGRLTNGIVVHITENPQYNANMDLQHSPNGSNNNSRETNCNFGEDHHLLLSNNRHNISSDSRIDDDRSLDDSLLFNSTQLTMLDMSTPRPKISPIIGPNG